MFYIRADGNEKIGMGHVMRTLTIAEALRKQGEEVLFLTADEKPVRLIEERGFGAKILFTHYDEMEVELPQLMTLLMGSVGGGEAGKPKILVDSYFVTEFYLKNLRLSAKVILMDDEKRAVYPCDGLVNYNIYGKTLGYEKDYPAETKLFLGCEYLPLREQFRGGGYEVRDAAEHILLTTGGGDHCHMALAAARRLLDKAKGVDVTGSAGQGVPCEETWHIVCGPYQQDTEELEELAAGSGILRIHKNVTDMSGLMRFCDIAVSAAGSTLYELCSIGVPTVGFYVAENQRRNMEAFAKLTPVMNAGDYSADPERVLDFIGKEVEVLRREKALREKISQVMRMLVDGKGAERLAEGICALR